MRFVLISVMLMGLAFYELSGGKDFVPPSQRQVSAAVTTEPAEPDSQAVSRSGIDPSVAELKVARVSTRGDAPEAELVKAVAIRNAPADSAAEAKPRPAAAAKTPKPNNIGEGTLKVIALTSPDPSEARARVQAALAKADVQDPAAPAARDTRSVTGTTVNMRNGPGTRYSVTDRLNRGDLVEVLQDPGNGWVKLRVKESGRIGWMADFLLASAD